MTIRTLSGPANGSFEVIDGTPRQVGESPVWDARTQTLLFASITEGTIHEVPVGPEPRRVHTFPGVVGSFGLCESGRLVVGLKDRVVLFDPDTGAMSELCRITHAVEQMRLNDGKVGPDGAFWVGSMDDRPVREPIGCLYRVSADGKCRVIADGLKVSNGLAWSPDGRRMYHSDSRGPWIDVWDFDPETGDASNRDRFADLDDATGRPDGGACDVDGNYWSAGPSAGVVNRFSPEGEWLSSIAIPNFRPTMPCFGGPDMRTLFVTSLSDGLTASDFAAHPEAGKLLATRVDSVGAPVARFRA